MIWKTVVWALGAALGFFLAARFVPGVTFAANWQSYALAGALFAVFYAVAAPILRLITFPLRVLTFNLFSLVIDMALVWIIDVLIPEMRINGLPALLETTLIILILNAILWQILSPSRK